VSDTAQQERPSWRISEWLRDVRVSRSKLYNAIRDGRVDVRKDGRATLILTSPRQYVESLPRGLGKPFGRGRKRRAGAAS
jgi:hypothetical protein